MAAAAALTTHTHCIEHLLGLTLQHVRLNESLPQTLFNMHLLTTNALEPKWYLWLPTNKILLNLSQLRIHLMLSFNFRSLKDIPHWPHIHDLAGIPLTLRDKDYDTDKAERETANWPSFVGPSSQRPYVHMLIQCSMLAWPDCLWEIFA